MTVSINTEVAGGAGSGGSGSLGGGGSGDATITEVSAVNSSGDLVTFKRAGVTVTRIYDVDGVTPLYDRTFGSTLQLDWLEDLGYYVGDIASNIIMPGGAIAMSWAQAITIGDAIIASTYTVPDGALRIFVRDIGDDGITMEWNNTLQWWRGINGERILLKRWGPEVSPFTQTALNQESGDRATYTLPGRLMAPKYGKIICNALVKHTTFFNVKTHRWYLGGSVSFFSLAPGSAGSDTTRTSGAYIYNNNSASAQRYSSSVGLYDAGGIGAIQTSAINTAVDQTVSFRYFLAGTAAANYDNAQYDQLELYLEN